MGRYMSEYVDERLQGAARATDDAEKKTLMEEAFIRLIDDVPAVPLGIGPKYSYWWPWVGGFYGEVGIETVYVSNYAEWWINSDLKAEMGY